MERRKANNRRLSRVSRVNRRRALLAEVEANELTLSQAGAALDWQMSEMATWQVQIEEKLKLRKELRAMQCPDAVE